MFDIDQNNIITITRGDTASVPLFMNIGTELNPIRYVLTSDDVVYLAIMEPNQYFETAIVKQEYTNADLNDDGDVELKFSHNDTKCLVPGKYYYEIKAKIKQANGSYEVNTIRPQTEFFITD